MTEIRKNKIKKILAIIMVAVTLTSCSFLEGAAAVVGKETVSRSTVKDSVKSVLSDRSKIDTEEMILVTGDDLFRDQLRFHVIALVVQSMADDLKIDFSRRQIDASEADLIAQAGGKSSLDRYLVSVSVASVDLKLFLITRMYADEIIKVIISNGVLPEAAAGELQKLILSKADQLKVEINEDYGIWDQSTGNIVPLY